MSDTHISNSCKNLCYDSSRFLYWQKLSDLVSCFYYLLLVVPPRKFPWVTEEHSLHLFWVQQSVSASAFLCFQDRYWAGSLPRYRKGCDKVVLAFWFIFAGLLDSRVLTDADVRKGMTNLRTCSPGRTVSHIHSTSGLR